MAGLLYIILVFIALTVTSAKHNKDDVHSASGVPASPAGKIGLHPGLNLLPSWFTKTDPSPPPDWLVPSDGKYGNSPAFGPHVKPSTKNSAPPKSERPVPPSTKDDVSPPPNWPPPSELEALHRRLPHGDLYFPGMPLYTLNAYVLAQRYNTEEGVGVVVMPESTEDVREIMKFVYKYKLKPTIQSSGHDYIGRNTGVHSFHINMARMQDMVVNLDDPDSDTGASAWIQPGIYMNRLYEEVDRYNKLVIGGTGVNVAAGGYLLGGGHSAMSPTLGLGVDSVLALTAVMADGSVVNVTESSISIEYPNGTWEQKPDSDLFWALRGGGGGTFAVVTNFNIKLYEPPEDGFVQMTVTYPLLYSEYPDIGKEIIDFFSNYFLTNMSEAGWGGYVLTNNLFQGNESDPDAPYFHGGMLFTLLHRGGFDKAWPSAQILYNFKPEWQGFRSLVTHSSYWEYQQTIAEQGIGRSYIFSRLLQKADFEETPDNLSEAMYEMLSVPYPMGNTAVILGGKVLEPPVESSSINPSFRTAWQAQIGGIAWENPDSDDFMIALLQPYVQKFYSLLGTGSYYNEPDSELINWKTDYWGNMERYNRLLDIKRKWDPYFLFRCHHCVGSDIEDPIPTTPPCVSDSP